MTTLADLSRTDRVDAVHPAIADTSPTPSGGSQRRHIPPPRAPRERVHPPACALLDAPAPRRTRPRTPICP